MLTHTHSATSHFLKETLSPLSVPTAHLLSEAFFLNLVPRQTDGIRNPTWLNA